MITLYGLKNCDTCKKALKTLADAGRETRFVDIRAEADLADRAPVWLAQIEPKRLVNTRSTTWRGLDDEQRVRAETDTAALLIDNPTLIKRPVIEAGSDVWVGWTKAVEVALVQA